MLAFLFGNRIGQSVLVIVAGFAIAAGFEIWLAAHDGDVAREARAGYVLLAEKTAAEAKAAELQRQVAAGAQALEEHRKRLLAAELEDQQQTAEREQEILTYETLLSQANRRCALSSDDIEFLQHGGKAPEQRRVGNRPIPGKGKSTRPSGRLPSEGAPRRPH